MSYNDNIFTVFDMMEKKGIFRMNPANRDSINPDTRQSAYKGPVQYPKMMYHPKGLTRITVPAEVISTPLGPKAVGEQRELVNKLVENAKEEAVLKHLGWLDHPAKSIYAGLTPEQQAAGEAPPISSEEQVKSLEQQIAELKAQLAAATGEPGFVTSSAEQDEADAALLALHA